MPLTPRRQRTSLPSWAVSALLHAVLLIGIGLALEGSPPRGGVGEKTAEVGIVLKHQDGESDYYEGEDDGGTDAATDPTSAPPTDMATTGGIASTAADAPAIDPTDVLPSSFALIGPGALESGGVGSAIGATTGPQGIGRSIGGKARTSVFGIEGEGYNFVYVFDRSDSMASYSGRPLATAKAQLIASLQSLEKTHQFQIIFYNHRPERFNASSKLHFASERNKRAAAKFVRGVIASGRTEHLPALSAAIKLAPDVIFFLTDADEPRLNDDELARIDRMAGGIVINTIEFGRGPQTDRNNFLVRLARQSGGQHRYCDVSRPMTEPQR